MRKILFIYIVVVFGFVQYTQAQEFNSDKQYEQAMQNAKQAFEAQQFSEAVMFYREAMKIKPDALLPRYKVEDIRTIYIEKELDIIKTEPVVEKPKINRKNKKEIKADKVILAEQAKVEATRKMNEDADKAEADLRNLKVEVIDIDDDIAPTELTDDFEVAEIAGSKEVLIKKVETKQQHIIKSNDIPENNTLKIEKRKVTVIEQNVEKSEKEPIPEKVATNTTTVKKKTYQPKKTKTTNTHGNKEWVEQEQKRLVKVYPNKKTIEQIEKPSKQITRIIMNINNKVTVYLKVKHSWGATYFFIDEIGSELRSINQQYFNLMTNLKTYGG